MGTSDLPVILFMLMPGFLVVRVHAWITHKPRLTDLELILWLLLASFSLLVPSAILWHWLDDSSPTVGSIIKDPTSMRLRVVLTAYAMAPLFGYAIGWADRSGLLEDSLRKIGVDLSRQQDVWHLAFRGSYYVIIYMKSGAMLYGWPALWTTDREGNATELYLQAVRVWDRKSQKWGPVQEHIDGVWVDCSGIDRIDFLKRPEPPLEPPAPLPRKLPEAMPKT